MAQSSIKTLPPELLEQLQAWLRDPRITQAEATERTNTVLEEMGLKPVSKSAVNRYSVEMNQIGEKIQQSREIAEMWVGKFGNQPQGKVGTLLNEIVRNLVFTTSIKLSETDEIIDPKSLKELAHALEKLENSATINEKRQREIEQAALAKAAKSLEAEAKNQGLTAATIDALKTKFLDD